MDHLGLTTWFDFAKAGPELLHDLLPCCQRWENEHDPDARQLPRAKSHDDKALAIARLGQS
jgi:hypothetical protein